MASADSNQHQTRNGDRNTLENTRARTTADNSGDGGSINNIGGFNSGNKFAVINSDDGYRSQFTAAKPVLDKYGFKKMIGISKPFNHATKHILVSPLDSSVHAMYLFTS